MGEPRYVDVILDELIDLKEDGHSAGHGYFNYATGLTMTNRRFAALFGAHRGARNRRCLNARWISPVRSSRDRGIVLRLAGTVAPRTEYRQFVPRWGRRAQLRRNGRLLREVHLRRCGYSRAGDAGGDRCALAVWHGISAIPAVPTDGIR